MDSERDRCVWHERLHILDERPLRADALTAFVLITDSVPVVTTASRYRGSWRKDDWSRAAPSRVYRGRS